MNKIATVAAAIAVALATTPVVAANYDVHMLNKGEAGAMVFEPGAVKVAPGDTVTFIPPTRAQCRNDQGTDPRRRGALQRQDQRQITVTFDAADIRHKYLPHLAMGMVMPWLSGICGAAR